MTDWIQNDDLLLAMVGEAIRWYDQHAERHDAQWQALMYDGTVVAVRCLATWPDGAKCHEMRWWPWMPMVGVGPAEQHTRYVDPPAPPAGGGRGYSDDRAIIDEAYVWARQNGKSIAMRGWVEPSMYVEARRQYDEGRGEWGDG